MLEKLYDMFRGLFDYEIVGEYYDMYRDEKGVCRYQKKYNRKYYLRCMKNRRKKKKRQKEGVAGWKRG